MLAAMPKTTEQRFWEKVNKDGPVPAYRPELGPCWVWTKALSKGYGAFRMDGKTRCAYVVAYELVVGPVPKGLELDHLCRVPACCHPAHLEPVTHQENVRRGRTPEVSGARQRAKTHCPHGHPYDAVNTSVRRGGRECRTCCRDRAKRYYEQKAA
jgi:hypothetical protein